MRLQGHSPNDVSGDVTKNFQGSPEVKLSEEHFLFKSFFDKMNIYRLTEKCSELGSYFPFRGWYAQLGFSKTPNILTSMADELKKT